jgi:hypothetical protein
LSEVIPARLIADGVGLPPVWMLWDGWDGSRRYALASDHITGMSGAEHRLDLSDPQTAFGVALRLDEWEPTDSAWAANMATDAGRRVCVPLMIARLTHIGQATTNNPQEKPL